MKKVLLLLIVCTIPGIINSTVTKSPDSPIKIMTFNIRVNVASDSMNAWPYRKDMAASMIQFHGADIVGLQEALWEQVEDLTDLLPEYSWFGIGRDDGDKSGEIMAIFYLKSRFTNLENSTFWLSENPDKPGRGWDAVCNRIVTWGRFKDNRTDKVIYLFNTHFDHMGIIARKESAKLLLRQFEKICGDTNAIVTGDFNCTPDSEPYKILTEKDDHGMDKKLIDTKTISQYPHHGPDGTFTGFKLTNLQQETQPIDHIFVSPGIEVVKHGTLSDIFDGRFPSDHFPVLAEIIIR